MKMKLARNLSNYRRQKGITQETMAERCGISRSAYAKWENGSTTPDIYHIETIADIFDITIDELVHGNSDPVSENSLSELCDMLGELKTICLKLAENAPLNSRNLYSDYISGTHMEKFDTIPTDIYVSLGSEEAAKGNYDIALQYLEEAILRGDIAAIDTMLVVYQEMLDIISDPDSSIYWDYRLKFARKMQQCGKIMEHEIQKSIY